MFVAVRIPSCILNTPSELLSPIVTTACNFVLSIFVLRPTQYLSHQTVLIGTGTTGPLHKLISLDLDRLQQFTRFFGYLSPKQLIVRLRRQLADLSHFFTDEVLQERLYISIVTTQFLTGIPILPCSQFIDVWDRVKKVCDFPCHGTDSGPVPKGLKIFIIQRFRFPHNISDNRYLLRLVRPPLFRIRGKKRGKRQSFPGIFRHGGGRNPRSGRFCFRILPFTNRLNLNELPFQQGGDFFPQHTFLTLNSHKQESGKKSPRRDHNDILQGGAPPSMAEESQKKVSLLHVPHPFQTGKINIRNPNSKVEAIINTPIPTTTTAFHQAKA